MSRLPRAPRECGSWIWELGGHEPPGLASALATAARMADVLIELNLLAPSKLEYDWFVYGRGGIGVTSTLALLVPLSDPSLVERIHQSQPVGFPTAEPDDIRVLGPGIWTDAAGLDHREPHLVELSVSPAPVGLSAELSVHHDVWSWYDFAGHPHPEVQKRNAPRLAAAIEKLDAVLGVSAFPGEPTYFGVAEGYGIHTPEAFEDGLGPDRTDKL